MLGLTVCLTLYQSAVTAPLIFLYCTDLLQLVRAGSHFTVCSCTGGTKGLVAANPSNTKGGLTHCWKDTHKARKMQQRKPSLLAHADSLLA